MGMPYHILDCISAISGANISPLLAFAFTGPFSFVFLTSHFLHCFPFLPRVLWRCWLGGRKGIRPVKNWWGTGMVICLERDAVCVFHSVFCSFFSRSFRLLAREIQQKVCEAFWDATASWPNIWQILVIAAVRNGACRHNSWSVMINGLDATSGRTYKWICFLIAIAILLLYECDWLNVSSGTGSPGQRAVKRLCVFSIAIDAFPWLAVVLLGSSGFHQWICMCLYVI